MQTFDASTFHRLETVAEVIVPSFAKLGENDRAEFRSIIDLALADRPPEVAKQLGLFLKIVTLAPVLRWGRSLAKLDSEKAHRALLWFQECKVGKIRQGFWGLRTLVFMGYYGRLDCWKEIGYSPEFDGRGGLDAQ